MDTIVVTKEQYEEFEEILNREPVYNEKLAELLNKTPWE